MNKLKDLKHRLLTPKENRLDSGFYRAGKEAETQFFDYLQRLQERGGNFEFRNVTDTEIDWTYHVDCLIDKDGGRYAVDIKSRKFRPDTNLYCVEVGADWSGRGWAESQTDTLTAAGFPITTDYVVSNDNGQWVWIEKEALEAEARKIIEGKEVADYNPRAPYIPFRSKKDAEGVAKKDVILFYLTRDDVYRLAKKVSKG